MEDGQGTIEIPMDPYPDLDVMTAKTIRGDLEFQSLKADTVIGADDSFVLFTEDVIQVAPRPGDER